MLTKADMPYAEKVLLSDALRAQSRDQLCNARTSLIRPDFAQTIAIHWHKCAIAWNRAQP